MNHSANENHVLTILWVSRGSSTPSRHARGWAQLNWERNESVHEVIPFTSLTEMIRSFERHVRDWHNTSCILSQACLWSGVADISVLFRMYQWQRNCNLITKNISFVLLESGRLNMNGFIFNSALTTVTAGNKSEWLVNNVWKLLALLWRQWRLHVQTWIAKQHHVCWTENVLLLYVN